jgi:hypothetical protein
MNIKSIKLLSFIGTVTTISVTIIELSNINFLIENKRLIYFSLIIAIIVCFILFWLYQKLTQITIGEIQIAVIGRPNVGKSVFIAIFFDELQRAEEKNYEFLISNKQTVERVCYDLSQLSIGVWLPCTSFAPEMSYKGTLIKNQLSKKVYNLTVTDYSGERFEKFKIEDQNINLLHNEIQFDFIHNERYFDYVKRSDIVFLTLDVTETINQHNIINDYLAAINLLASYEKEKRISRPITLLFLKSDRLGGEPEFLNENQIENKYSKLIEVFRKRCIHFNYFFVSSIGKDAKKFWNYEGENPNLKSNIVIRPMNVLTPFFWSLRKIGI